MKMIDPMDLSVQPILSKLQGNILKGHGRKHTTHIFIHFDNNAQKRAKKWLKEFAGENLTSCLKQLSDRELFKRNNVDGGTFTSIFLSKSGYDYLGFEDKLTDSAFNDGMKQRKDILQDPVKSKWDTGFREDIHLMILLADDDINRMGQMSYQLLHELDGFSRISNIEYGNAIRNENGDGIEHFGYVDGISQPLFLQDEVDAYHKFHNTATNGVNFNPEADTNLVLVNDPFVNDNQAFGSYFVFRKLEQNVKKFKKAEERLGLDELGGAYLVGRFEDGTPVVLQEDEGQYGSGNFNNFNYDNDPSGGRCPHFAHIRKTNPRFIDNSDKKRIMARRGIPYGHREVSTTIKQHESQMPEKGVGLLFMSYQASIEEQFEFIQTLWANNPDFPTSNTDIDPIIGQSDKDVHTFAFPETYGGATTTNKDFKKFVTMKGGEYFFAPSITFFENL